jgi:membrane protein
MAQSAALAFYTLFSLAPLLIVVIAVAGLVFGEDAVRGQIVSQFAGLMGADAAAAVQRILQRVANSRSSGLAGVLGILTLVFGATGAFVQLQSSLNRIWDVAPQPGHLLRTLLRKRLTSFGLILAIGFFLLVSLALSAAVTGLAGYLNRRLAIPAGVLEAVDVILSFVAFSFFFAMIFRILPDAEISWRDVLLGAVVTSLLFSIGKSLIGLYLGRTAVASPYGAAGSIVVILLWVYYASAILLLGAEFTRSYSRVFYGTRSEASPGAERLGRMRGGLSTGTR